MPIFRHFRHLRCKVLSGLAALALISLGLPGLTLAQQRDEFALQFYSFVPAEPIFKLPKLDDVVVWRSDMRKARRAWRNGSYKKARRHLQKALNKGNVIAAWYLGHLHDQGRGVKKDDARAFTYYRQVAATYEPDALRNRRLMIVIDSLVRVADTYREGSITAGVNREPGRAFNIYNVAASHGHPGADYGLGVMHLNGIGISKNPKRAFHWLRRAARKRFAPAKALLGEIYWNGNYVHRDRARAIMWYILARQTARPSIHPHIFDRLDVMLANASEDQRASAQVLASRWSKEHPVRESIVPAAD